MENFQCKPGYYPRYYYGSNNKRMYYCAEPAPLRTRSR